MVEVACGRGGSEERVAVEVVLWSGGTPNVSREHVQTYLESHQKEFQVYAAIAKTLRKEKANDPQLPFCLMTLNFGRHHTAAMVKWCKETLAELDGMERRQKGGK